MTRTEAAVEFITSESIRAKNLLLTPPIPNKTVNGQPIFELDNPVWLPLEWQLSKDSKWTSTQKQKTHTIKNFEMRLEVDDNNFWSVESAINTTLIFNFGSALVTKSVPKDLTKSLIDFAKAKNNFVGIPLNKLVKDGYDSFTKNDNVRPIRRFQTIPMGISENIDGCSEEEKIKVENFIAQCEDRFYDRTTVCGEEDIDWILYDGKPVTLQFSDCADMSMLVNAQEQFRDEEIERAKQGHFMEYESGLQLYHNESYALLEIRMWNLSRFFGVPDEITKSAISYFSTLGLGVEVKSKTTEKARLT